MGITGFSIGLFTLIVFCLFIYKVFRLVSKGLSPKVAKKVALCISLSFLLSVLMAVSIMMISLPTK